MLKDKFKYSHDCPSCGYEWRSYTKDTKKCPRCGFRLDLQRMREEEFADREEGN